MRSMKAAGVELQPLAGWRVLVTRPAQQAAGLCRLIERQGGLALAFPTVAIGPPRDPEPLRALPAVLHEYACAIFVSVNAVQALRAALAAWPAALPCLAIGEATAAALRAAGAQSVIATPAQADSEALLAHPALSAVAGRRLLIVRGEDGRPLLAETLAARGARVDSVAVYRRGLPAQPDLSALAALWRAGQCAAITATSVSTLDNLFTLAASRQVQLRDTPFAVLSLRIAERARAQGIAAPIAIAPQASDAGLTAALTALAQEDNRP